MPSSLAVEGLASCHHLSLQNMACHRKFEMFDMFSLDSVQCSNPNRFECPPKISMERELLSMDSKNEMDNLESWFKPAETSAES